MDTSVYRGTAANPTAHQLGRATSECHYKEASERAQEASLRGYEMQWSCGSAH